MEMMKKFVKPATLFPILAGAAVGILLFILGDADDAPGLSFIGLVVGFLLIMWGIYNTGIIKKGLFVPILLFCFGAVGIIFSVVLLLDGEFEETPWLSLIGVIFGIVFIAIGMILLRKTKK